MQTCIRAYTRTHTGIHTKRMQTARRSFWCHAAAARHLIRSVILLSYTDLIGFLSYFIHPHTYYFILLFYLFLNFDGPDFNYTQLYLHIYSHRCTCIHLYTKTHKHDAHAYMPTIVKKSDIQKHPCQHSYIDIKHNVQKHRYAERRKANRTYRAACHMKKNF